MENKIMTPERKRIVIAEHCGYKFVDDESGFSFYSPVKYANGTVKTEFQQSTHTGRRYSPDDEKHFLRVKANYVPNYPESLDAMHEAEKHLTDEQVLAYQADLIITCVTMKKLFKSGREYPADGYMLHANSEQRSDCYCKAIGKWEE